MQSSTPNSMDPLLADNSLLKNLMWFRCFETFALIFAALCCHFLFAIEVSHTHLVLSVGLLAFGTLALLVRLSKPWPTSQLELFTNLMLDSLVLFLFLTGTGGASNPFISLYLVLIAVSASVLSLSLSLTVTLFASALYTYMFTNMEADHGLHEGMAGTNFQLHLAGMWVNFLLSAICLLVFIHLLRKAIALREEQINQEKEQAIHNQHILAIGSLAAGAAHELSTPLSTLNLLSERLLENSADEQANKDLYLLRDQLLLCKNTVDSLRISAADPDNVFLESKALKLHLEDIFDTWLLLWPNIDEHIHYQEPFYNPVIAFDRRLQQSLLSLLNNASEASTNNASHRVFINISCSKDTLLIKIYDEGPGLPSQMLNPKQKAFASSKRDGPGLGLMLSYSNVEQLQGQFELSNQTHPNSNANQGACATIKLDIQFLISNAQRNT